MRRAATPFEDEALHWKSWKRPCHRAVVSESLRMCRLAISFRRNDPSTIVAPYHGNIRRQPVRTYTLGFEDPAYDEAPAARAVARHLRTDHYTKLYSAHDAQDVIPKLHGFTGNRSPIHRRFRPILSAPREGRSYVAMSGDGGDQLFGGYNRYLGLAGVWTSLDDQPVNARYRRRECARGNSRQACGMGWPALPGGRLRSVLAVRFSEVLGVMGQVTDTDGLLGGFLDEWWGEGSAGSGTC